MSNNSQMRGTTGKTTREFIQRLIDRLLWNSQKEKSAGGSHHRFSVSKATRSHEVIRWNAKLAFVKRFNGYNTGHIDLRRGQ